jgi:hypothetical protein
VIPGASSAQESHETKIEAIKSNILRPHIPGHEFRIAFFFAISAM